MAVLHINKKGQTSVKLTALDVEVAVGNYLNWCTNLIIPNISWSFFKHECDLIRLSRLGYCTEIEIKVTKPDLIKDKEKKQGHFHKKIKYLYFAIPDYLENCIEHVPERAGIIIVSSTKKVMLRRMKTYRCKIKRNPVKNGDYQFTKKEMNKCLELMAMRIWRLKLKLANGK